MSTARVPDRYPGSPASRAASGRRLVALVFLCSLAVMGVRAETGNRAHDELLRTVPSQQRRIADTVLRQVGHGDCDVARLVLLEYRSGQFASWQASCTDGRRFVLNFRDDPEGTVEILTCRELEAYGAACAE